MNQSGPEINHPPKKTNFRTAGAYKKVSSEGHNVKKTLDRIYYLFGQQQTNYFVTGSQRKGENTIWRKWKTYMQTAGDIDPWESWKINWINHRQILPNEVVIDLEEHKLIEPVVKELKEKEFQILTYTTGSRGAHIHIWLNKEIKEKDKLKIIKYYKGDSQKAGDKSIIAVEGQPHWKSGKIKTVMEEHSSWPIITLTR